jgi:competence transcription factor ComK
MADMCVAINKNPPIIIKINCAFLTFVNLSLSKPQVDGIIHKFVQTIKEYIDEAEIY